MKITYHGHSVIAIETQQTNILVDPFITGNRSTDLTVDTVSADWLLVTHGHSDHLGDTVPIAKRTGATVVSMVEVCSFVAKQGVEKTHGMNIGGKFLFPFGTVKMVAAQHSSGYEKDGEMIYLGEPAGFLLEIEGKRIYLAGDTALFSDMALFGKEGIDIAFLPIGDNFTMGPEDAAQAAKLLQAKKVVPIHYNTFPVIQQDPQKFIDLLPGNGEVLSVGQTIEV
ncbi:MULTISPECIES: metal-dependent hydrolase [Enterococcus]|uniref:metal-dependent hydrolase n=1 Tax=Enterococcus TaxID=1350 RepID=UPI00065DDD56|nr:MULTISPECIES: metal-dependent hydrolase [Enterococcus]